MTLKHLTLKHVRNYEEVSFSFKEGINLLVGKNGVGKTNVLEAIYLLGSGKSFRTHKDRDICRKGDTFYYVKGAFSSETTGMTTTLEISYHEGAKRVAIDRKEVQKRREIIGKFLIILFLPGDTALVEGEPTRRRDFFNMFISNVDSDYLAALVDYFHILKNRNICLKVQNGEYSLYDEELAKKGYFIIERAREYTREITKKMNVLHKDIFGVEAAYDLRYDDGAGKVASAEELLTKLKNTAPAQEKMRTTTIGPHRSDFKIIYKGIEARYFASQGEKRSISVLMKLAEDAIIEELRNERPILLIDDALLELDRDTREAFIRYLKRKGQIFMTMTERENVPADIGGTVIDVATYTSSHR